MHSLYPLYFQFYPSYGVNNRLYLKISDFRVDFKSVFNIFIEIIQIVYLDAGT